MLRCTVFVTSYDKGARRIIETSFTRINSLYGIHGRMFDQLLHLIRYNYDCLSEHKLGHHPPLVVDKKKICLTYLGTDPLRPIEPEVNQIDWELEIVHRGLTLAKTSLSFHRDMQNFRPGRAIHTTSLGGLKLQRLQLSKLAGKFQNLCLSEHGLKHIPVLYDAADLFVYLSSSEF
jgi:hypothetical protein